MDFSLSAAHETYLASIRAFASTRVAPEAARIDETGEFPAALIAEAAALGLMGVTIPRENGGAGLDYVAYVMAIEAIARASATLAVILTVNNSLVVEAIAQHGTPEQQQRWVKPLASGKAIGAFALSEANAGSDAANQQTLATPRGQDYVLNGTKVWVANATRADVAIVFALTEAGVRARGISAFLVPLETPGISRRGSDSLGVRGLGCMDLTFRDVLVPAANMLGEAGRGFKLAMHALEGGRIAIAAQALGLGQAALDEAVGYARRREVFGQSIGDFQAVQFQLADLATELEAARMLTWRAADSHDRKPRVTLEASMAKLHASEAAHRAADRAMQILASEGYRRGSTVERLFRDVRAAEIYQGTSEVQRMIIAEQLIDRKR
jgi:alkylation response protein AidB-like acyl-CoA dehydrogenase